jgi:hypothetical protein
VIKDDRGHGLRGDHLISKVGVRVCSAGCSESVRPRVAWVSVGNNGITPPGLHIVLPLCSFSHPRHYERIEWLKGLCGYGLYMQGRDCIYQPCVNYSIIEILGS